MSIIETVAAVAAPPDAPRSAGTGGAGATEALPGETVRSLVLVGLMGAGKSSIGRRLAHRLGFDFLDADVEIEKAAGATIPEIFAEHGETAFRDGERKVIARLLDQPRIVLATGGGAYMNAETRARIRERGRSIWIKADLDVLVKRCARRSNRPLLANGDLRGTLEKLMRERYPVYAEADVTVTSIEGPHDAVVEQIIQALPADYRQVADASTTASD
ncbi:shikimate kinase [Ferrovibrio terrae]|uniref:shikimate kinase n=1 Tax=Ferrovibrio terrae TaxID=2594003 RepID=UPI0031381BB8